MRHNTQCIAQYALILVYRLSRHTPLILLMYTQQSLNKHKYTHNALATCAIIVVNAFTSKVNMTHMFANILRTPLSSVCQMAVESGSNGRGN